MKRFVKPELIISKFSEEVSMDVLSYNSIKTKETFSTNENMTQIIKYKYFE